MMVLVTTFVGFYLGAAGPPDWLTLLHTLASTGVAAAGTLALNQYLERDLDALLALESDCLTKDGLVVTECRYLIVALKL